MPCTSVSNYIHTIACCVPKDTARNNYNYHNELNVNIQTTCLQRLEKLEAEYVKPETECHCYITNREKDLGSTILSKSYKYDIVVCVSMSRLCCNNMVLMEIIHFYAYSIFTVGLKGAFPFLRNFTED